MIRILNYYMLFGIFLSWTIIMVYPQMIFGQSEGEEISPKGNVVNSKYLTILEHRYRTGAFPDMITGTIVNNSTQEITLAIIHAALYDKNNTLITMGIGSADVSSLPPGDNSAFLINLFGLKDDEDIVDHYTLFPAGTP